jgi:dienelactone hydrolase
MSLALALLLPALACAQDLPVASWDESFNDDEAGQVWIRVHYPAVSADWGADADPTGGPYPLVALIHGAFGQAWMYDDVGDRLAAEGFLVVSMDTEVGPWIDTDRLAADAHAALLWAEDRAADPDHWLHGMTGDGDWSAVGHSMGGIASATLVGREPRVRRVVGAMPYEPGGDEHANYAGWDGAALMIGGSEDDTSVPQMLTDWFSALTDAERALYLSIEGAGH